MQHLVGSDVVQNEADSFCRVQASWYRNQLALRQADELSVRSADRHRGNNLAGFDCRDTVAKPIHDANQVPAWGERQSGRFGVNALTRQYIGQSHTRSQNLYPRFTTLRLGALLFKHLQCVGPAIVSDDDPRMSHERAILPRGLDYVRSTFVCL